MKRKHLIFTAKLTSGLKEKLESEKPITYDTFWKLVVNGIYRYEAYDDRIKAYIYILTDIEKNIGMPVYIHYYGVRKPI